MVIVHAAVTTPAGKRNAFVEAAQPCIAATRKEEGCLQYDLMAATDNDTDLLYVERWSSREALDRHLNTPHMQEFGRVKAEKGLQTGDTGISVFEVAG